MKGLLIAIATSAAIIIMPQPPTEAAELGQISSYELKENSSEYIVKPKDTLYKIAHQFHCKLQDLINANPVLKPKNGSYITPGQRLTLPTNEVLTGYEKQVLNLTNQARAQAGLAPLQGTDTALNRAARVKAEDMAHNNYFSHNSPTYGDPFTMMRGLGVQFSAAGENIAKGQQTPQEVVKAWLNSPGHRANIMNTNYQFLGVGYEANAKCWVQQFAAK